MRSLDDGLRLEGGDVREEITRTIVLFSPVRGVPRPTKGGLTRQAIVERAARLASKLGLEGLTIGLLADDLALSKSGLFAHFKSKEGLQLQVLEFGIERFGDAVVRPALRASRGEERIRALFEHWLEWPASSGMAGCLFVAFAAELDDRPGPLRSRLVEAQRDWLKVIANSVRLGIDVGDFRTDVDPAQFAHDLYGIMLASHHATRLLRDQRARARADRAFERLLFTALSDSARNARQ